MMKLFVPQPFAALHPLADFGCDVPDLDNWPKRWVLPC